MMVLIFVILSIDLFLKLIYENFVDYRVEFNVYYDIWITIC